MSYGVRIVRGAAENFEEYASILESQLLTLGLKPKRDISPAGNCFKIKGGFGCRAVVYYKSVGNDVMVTPEVGRSLVGTILPVFALVLLLIPGIFWWVWIDRNLRRTVGKVLSSLEASMATYKASFPPKPAKVEK